MKSLDSLKRSYDRQKKIFDDKETLRQTNLRQQLTQIEEKINKLQSRKAELTLQISNRKEFESFESFRERATEQSTQSKTVS